jgi:hypothetical protein
VLGAMQTLCLGASVGSACVLIVATIEHFVNKPLLHTPGVDFVDGLRQLRHIITVYASDVDSCECEWPACLQQDAEQASAQTYSQQSSTLSGWDEKVSP